MAGVLPYAQQKRCPENGHLFFYILEKEYYEPREVDGRNNR
jgi:hypothetical protein